MDSKDAAAAGVTRTPPVPPASPRSSRSRTMPRKRLSEVYWLMPIPRENGNDPRFRSCGRQPSTVVSRVTTSAPAPLASARAMRLSTSSSSVDQYSWNQCPGISLDPLDDLQAAAVSSSGEDPWLLTT